MIIITTTMPTEIKNNFKFVLFNVHINVQLFFYLGSKLYITRHIFSTEFLFIIMKS